MKPVTERGFAAIRTGALLGDWLVIDSIGMSPGQVQRKCDVVDEKRPHWSQSNPVTRIVKVEIKEVIVREVEAP